MNNQNNCTKYRKDIAALVLGVLEPKDAEKIQEHLETCQNCKALYQTMLNEEKDILLSFKEISQKGETIQNSLIEKLDNKKIEIKIQPLKKQENIWRNIIKNKIIKNATAAAIIIVAVLIGLHYSGGSIDGTSIALGKTIENMKKMQWVHSLTTAVESENKINEKWYGLEKGISASKYYIESKLLYINKKENTEYVYRENEGKIYYSQIDDSIRSSSYIPDSEFALLETNMDYIDKYATDVTRKTTNKDGREIEIITANASNNKESIFHELELIRNIQENLIISVKIDYKDVPEYILSNEPNEVKEGWIRARIDTFTKYDYPATGPGNIYDLGAPRNSEVVKSLLPAEIQDMILKLNNLRETTLTEYLVIAISGNSDTLPTSPEGLRSTAFFYNNDISIYSIWRKGDLIRFSQGYFPVLENMPSRNDIKENVESWFEEIIPVREFINLPEDEYQYHNYYWENIGKNITNDKIMNNHYLYDSDEYLIENCWPKIDVPRQMAMQWSLEHIDGRDGEKLIMITRQIDITTEKWYINPDKNDICQKHEAYSSDGTLVYRKEILEYATTESGQFYPRKIQMTRNIKHDNKIETDIATKIIYLKENPEYPDWIFDLESFPKSFQ